MGGSDVSNSPQPSLIRSLSLLDAILLLVSGVIGSSIFLTAKDIAGPLPHPALFFLVWVFGAVVSLFACFAFAELGTMFPDSGGQYVYLREAFGDLVAFLYGWMLFAVANGGTIAALAVASATYAGRIFPAVGQEHIIFSVLGISFTRAHFLALVLIAILTGINVIGLRWGALLNSLSTWTKCLAMTAFVVLGFAIGKGRWSNFSSHGMGLSAGLSSGQLASAMGVALIAVFFAYDGWVYVTWVSGEIKNPRRNVPLAMVLGVLAVGMVLHPDEHDLCVRDAAFGSSPTRNHRTHRRRDVVFACGRSLVVGASGDLVFQRSGKLHVIRRPRVFGNGTRWSLLQEHGAGASALADACVQPHRPGHLGGDVDA